MGACLPILPPLIRRLNRSFGVPSFISSTNASVHSIFSKFSVSSATGHSTANSNTAATASVITERDPTGVNTQQSNLSNSKKDTKEWYPVGLSNLDANGRDEEGSQSSETLIHEKKAMPHDTV